MPRTMPNESRRARSSAQTPPRRRAPGARQIRSSAFCSSPNTDDRADEQRDDAETVPSDALRRLVDALAAAPATAAAPSSPIRSRSSAKIWPRAASAPKTRPAIEMTISSSGAIENSV